ncbi:zinc-binding dehydrogenase [Nocardia sp. NPDC050793]|uniref:zinc-binding dehydrogenase n=1 Tax=Nocardia sp. NPDC050793 TaxID=3155159 RepID=UPI0033D509F4
MDVARYPRAANRIRAAAKMRSEVVNGLPSVKMSGRVLTHSQSMAAAIIRMRSTGCGDRREGIFAMFAVRQHKFGPPDCLIPDGLRQLKTRALSELAAGRWTPDVQEFALADAAAAHAALENRTAVGKVVLVP